MDSNTKIRMVKNVRSKLIFLLISLFGSFCGWSATPHDTLQEAISLVGPYRDWNNALIGAKLREVRGNFAGTQDAISASALLALYLTQIPGDHQGEILALCNEVTAKAPQSWQAWVANMARIALSGLQTKENNTTLNIALNALAETDGVQLSQHAEIILKPLMDQWPPVPTDFTDQMHAVISQQALILGKHELALQHHADIVNPRLKSQGERRIAHYFLEISKAKESENVKNILKIDKANSLSTSTDSVVPLIPSNEAQPIEPKQAQTMRKTPLLLSPNAIIVLIVVATGMLWPLLKKRRQG